MKNPILAFHVIEGVLLCAAVACSTGNVENGGNSSAGVDQTLWFLKNFRGGCYSFDYIHDCSGWAIGKVMRWF
jgi:hypothetical protein